jgi:hypothetical protein
MLLVVAERLLILAFGFGRCGVVGKACPEILLEILLTFTLLKSGSWVSHTHLNWNSPKSHTYLTAI